MEQIIAGSEGFVGKELFRLFDGKADKYDPPAGIEGNFESKYKVCHICVPTPAKEDGSCDISAVEEVVKKINADLYIIHSTVPPGTVDKLEEYQTDGCSYGFKRNIIMQPEYCSSDAIYPQPLASMKNMPFIILGGRSENTKKARRLYEKVYPPTIKILEVSAKTAEVIKYFENTFISTKLTFCNEMFKTCKAFGVDYDKVREGVFQCDPRMTDYWTLSEGKGYKSKCLDKDVPAIISASERVGYDPKFLKEVIKNNDRHKRSANG